MRTPPRRKDWSDPFWSHHREITLDEVLMLTDKVDCKRYQDGVESGRIDKILSIRDWSEKWKSVTPYSWVGMKWYIEGFKDDSANYWLNLSPIHKHRLPATSTKRLVEAGVTSDYLAGIDPQLIEATSLRRINPHHVKRIMDAYKSGVISADLFILFLSDDSLNTGEKSLEAAQELKSAFDKMALRVGAEEIPGRFVSSSILMIMTEHRDWSKKRWNINNDPRRFLPDILDFVNRIETMYQYGTLVSIQTAGRITLIGKVADAIIDGAPREWVMEYLDISQK